jgi:hypothetical protein
MKVAVILCAFELKNNNEKIVITGATGQLGSELKVLSENYGNTNGSLQIERKFH